MRHTVGPVDAPEEYGPLGAFRDGLHLPILDLVHRCYLEGRARHATDDRSQVHGADDAGVRGDPRLLYADGSDQGARRDGEGGHTPHHDPRREGRCVHG